MKKLNSFTFAPGSQGRLQRPVQAEANQRVTKLLLKASVVLANTGSQYDPTSTDVVNLCSYLFGALTLKFGKSVQETIFQGLDFASLRQHYWYMSNGRDFRVSSPTTTALAEKEIQAVSSSDLRIAATTGQRTIVLKIVIPFLCERLASDPDRWCPSGVLQINDMELYFDPGSTFSASSGAVTTTGNCTVDVIIDTVSGSDAEGWANVIRNRKIYNTGLDVYLPDDCGALVGLWDQNAAGASTALTYFSIYRQSDSPIHNNALAADVVNDANTQELPGATGNQLSTLATPLYSVDSTVDPEDLPTGAGWYFHQNSQDLATVKLSAAYAPKIDQSYVNMVASNVWATFGKQADLVTVDAANGKAKQVPGHVTAVAPISVILEGDPKYGSRPAVRVGPGGQTQAFTPASVVADAKGMNSTTAGKEISKSIPGGRSPVRGSITPSVVQNKAAVGS